LIFHSQWGHHISIYSHSTLPFSFQSHPAQGAPASKMTMGALDTQRGIRRNRRPIGCLTGYHFSSRVLPFNIQGHVVHPHRSNRILSMSAVNNYNYNNCEAKNDGTDQKKKAWIHPSYLKHSMTFWNPTGPGPIEKDGKGKAFMKNGWCSGGHHSGFHVVSKSSWTPHLWQASPNQPIWLVVSNMLIFHFIYGIDFHIFQDGYCTTNQLLY